MITDSIIRKSFVHDTLKQGITKIYATQEEVVRTHLKERTGALRSYLMRRPFSIEGSQESQTLFVRILPYLRFLDMAYRLRKDRISKTKHRNLSLYNRVVWGVLYHETFPELQHGFTDEVRTQIRKQLETAMKE